MCSLSLTGMDGRIYHTTRIPLEKGQTGTRIDLTGYSKGIYLVQLKTDREVVSRQLVVQ